MHRRCLALAFACAAGAASAQVTTDPDWKEVEAPPPPALRSTGLVALEMPSSSLRFGVDPESVVVGSDRVVRYVVVATSTTGTVNAMYEGLRCNTGEVKVYARHNPDSGWVPVRNAEWRALHETQNTRHSLLIARTGACIGHAANGNGAEIVRALRAPGDTRFRQR
jgi:hypothetical protein